MRTSRQRIQDDVRDFTLANFDKISANLDEEDSRTQIGIKDFIVRHAILNYSRNH